MVRPLHALALLVTPWLQASAPAPKQAPTSQVEERRQPVKKKPVRTHTSAWLSKRTGGLALLIPLIGLAAWKYSQAQHELLPTLPPRGAFDRVIEGKDYSGAQMRRRADYSDCLLLNVNFQGASFPSGSRFRRAHLVGCTFQGASWAGPADFNGAVFHTPTDFSGARLRGGLYAFSACWAAGTDFSGAQVCRELKLGGSRGPIPSFQDATLWIGGWDWATLQAADMLTEATWMKGRLAPS